MRKNILILLLLFFAIGIHGQEKKLNSDDETLKELIYSKNKKTVMNFSMKEFETLFFEFVRKKADQSLVLNKQEFYTYTIKIAIFSDRLATLYPKEKQTAEESKKKWMSESYEDYLLSKQIQK